ncbi:hypothetical protein K1T71_009438 [Dendrolimus kikuchii]|uniref:Uncharacterized protein n=1 Tax=Dendrolimus kikuchii TaxID=765133 RepID=A0ACC1CW06_9NEOP|nr:hypothetical protein K1T71_009438 [Dendrolimus kikuchii]
MTVPKTWTKFADDVLVDPIKLIEPEGTKVHFESCDLSGTEILDYGYKLEIQESDFQDSTVQLPLREQPSEIIPHKRNIVKRSLSVKLVDCKTFPWYYKKYKRQLYNIAATIDLSATNENMQEAISLVEEDSPNNGEPLKTFTYVNSSKDPKEVKKWNYANSEYCLDLIKQKALKQKGSNKIDFKRNKGLIGLTIKRNVRFEKLKRGNVLAENTSNGAKVDDNEKNASIDGDVVCEYIIEHETVTINNNIENDMTSIKPKSIALNEKPKSSLSPGSYKLSHLTTGEKVITLVKSPKHTFDPNKSALSPTRVPTVTQSEKLSKIIKNCKRRSYKKPGPKSKLIKNKNEKTKEKLDKTQTLQKTIEKLLNKPMPKSRKLQLQKQRRENERKTKKYLKNIENKVISRQAIIIGSRVSVPSQKSSDTKSSVECKTSNSTSTLKQLLGSDTLKNRDYCDSESLNIASFQSDKLLNNNICSRQTSPKMSSDSKIEFVNSNSYNTDLTEKEKNDLVQFDFAHTLIYAKIVTFYVYKKEIKYVLKRFLEETRHVYCSIELDKASVRLFVRYCAALVGASYITLGSTFVEAYRAHVNEGIPIRTEVTYLPTRNQTGVSINVFRFFIEFHWYYIVGIMSTIDSLTVCCLVFLGMSARNVQKTFGIFYNIQILETVTLLVMCLVKVSAERHTVYLLANLAYIACLIVLTGAYMLPAGDITHEASLLSTSIFHCGWELAACRTDLRVLAVIALQRSQVPVTMTAFGILTLSYTNLITVLRSSYSFFAVMY